jgi:hypothetical protein
MKNRPEITLRTLTPGQERDLWRALDVKGTPTIVVENLKTGRSAILRGLAVESKLDAALSEVALSDQSKEKPRAK